VRSVKIIIPVTLMLFFAVCVTVGLVAVVIIQMLKMILHCEMTCPMFALIV